MKLGQQHVVLIEVQVPKKSNRSTIDDLIKVQLRYFNPTENRYYFSQSKLSAGYTEDINQALTEHHSLVHRSLLLIQNAETLKNVTKAIKTRRIYIGMSLLSKQIQKLKRAGNDLDDPILLRDAKVFEKYMHKLYEFSDTTFQGLKLWLDTFGKGRYQSNLE